MKYSIKFLFVLVLVGFFAAIIYYTGYRPFKGTDDAYIYFVYAKNIANGHGLVYTPGGESVEGFTSMLWMFIITAFYLITVNFQYALMALNVFMVSYALYRLVRFIDEYYIKDNKSIISAPSLFFLLLVLMVKGYLDWTVFSLLETGLWSTLLILCSVFLLEAATGQIKLLRQRIYFSVLLGLLVLTRPESLLWGSVFIVLFGFINWHHSKNVKKVITALSYPLGFFLLTVILLTSFRLYYFGYPLPNTYYAKVSANWIYNFKEGIIYFLKYLFVYPLHVIPVVFAVVSFLIIIINQVGKAKRAMDNFTLSQLVNSVIVLVALSIPLLTGGDHFSLFRLYQPLVPVFFVLLFNMPFIKKQFFTIYTNTRWRKYLVFILLLLILPVIYLMNMPKYFINSEKVPYKVSLLNDFSFAESHRKESELLNKFFDYTPKPSFGRIWAGGYAYAYSGPTVDLMGLNNTLMAHATKEKIGLKNHAAFDKNTFYLLKPDLLISVIVEDTSNFILPENSSDFDNSFDNNAMKNIFRDEQFINLYQPVLITNNNLHLTLFTYARNDYIPILKEHGLVIKILKREYR